jgi:peroxiredoxin-like protein
MIDSHEYPVTVRWRLPELTVATPPEFGGPAQQWSPEHLFVAAVASCFLTTFLALSATSRLEIRGIEVPGVGRLVRGEDRRYRIESIHLEPHIQIADEKDRERAGRLAAKAEELCLISRSIRSNVTLGPVIELTADRPASE